MGFTQGTFRYDTSGNWFKGNTHIHSLASDGGMSVSEIAELYAEHGYRFVFITDHNTASDLQSYPAAAPLLLMPGAEFDGNDSSGSYFHVVFLGKTEGLSKQDGLEDTMQKARQQGALLVLAHPQWTGNNLEDAVRHKFDGVELYNHVCHWLNGKDNGITYWDAMLRENRNTLGFSADDAHLKPEHPGYNGGWIVINSAELNYSSVMSAIRKGNYYSSCGPDFTSIQLHGNILHIECSPVKFIRLTGAGFNGWRTGSFDGSLLTQVEIPLTEEMEQWQYMYLEIEDAAGKRAWSNPLFC